MNECLTDPILKFQWVVMIETGEAVEAWCEGVEGGELRERFVIPLPVIDFKMSYDFLRILFK